MVYVIYYEAEKEAYGGKVKYIMTEVFTDKSKALNRLNDVANGSYTGINKCIIK